MKCLDGSYLNKVIELRSLWWAKYVKSHQSRSRRILYIHAFVYLGMSLTKKCDFAWVSPITFASTLSFLSYLILPLVLIIKSHIKICFLRKAVKVIKYTYIFIYKSLPAFFMHTKKVLNLIKFLLKSNKFSILPY